jgi:hypothetical protein
MAPDVQHIFVALTKNHKHFTMRVAVSCVVSTGPFNINTLRSHDFVFVISMFEALCAIESAVAVNPDLRLELYVRPQTAS